MAKALDDYIYCSAFLSVASLDRLLDGPNEDGPSFDVPNFEPLADEQFDRHRVYDTIHGAVDCLPPRQREAIEAIYFAEDTVAQAAMKLKVTGAAVVKLRTKALKHLLSALAPHRHALFA
jgi:DNA-directed RNA polymerase specialized sigma24 family protein